MPPAAPRLSEGAGENTGHVGKQVALEEVGVGKGVRIFDEVHAVQGRADPAGEAPPEASEVALGEQARLPVHPGQRGCSVRGADRSLQGDWGGVCKGGQGGRRVGGGGLHGSKGRGREARRGCEGRGTAGSRGALRRGVGELEGRAEGLSQAEGPAPRPSSGDTAHPGGYQLLPSEEWEAGTFRLFIPGGVSRSTC